jgi:hypothetical protein
MYTGENGPMAAKECRNEILMQLLEQLFAIVLKKSKQKFKFFILFHKAP